MTKLELLEEIRGTRGMRTLLAETYMRAGTVRLAARELGIGIPTFKNACEKYRVSIRRPGGWKRGGKRTGLGALPEEILFGESARVVAERYRVSTQAVYSARRSRRNQPAQLTEKSDGSTTPGT